MGARHSRHQRPGHLHDTSRLSATTTVSSRDTVATPRGLDEVDFQAAPRGSSNRQNPRRRPTPPQAPSSPTSLLGEADVTQPMVPELPRTPTTPGGLGPDDLGTSDPATPGSRPSSSSTEENGLLQSIFNDLEKAWSKSQVSTPISKDYYKLEPLENSLQPIPLAESFGDDETRSGGLKSKDTSRDFNTTHSDDLYPVEEAEAAIPEDTYMNNHSEVHLVQVEEDMYINCQAERHEAELEEDQAQEDMEKVQRELDRVLQDDIEMSHTEEPHNVSYRALYAYSPRHQDELLIQPNDLLIHVCTESAQWVRVCNTSGEEGLVPSTYIENEGQSPSHHSRRHRSPETPDSDDWDNEFDNDIEGDITATEYAVIYDYDAQQEGDLTLRIGDRVAVFETHDTGWWKGFSCGREGWFPATYVEMATSDSTPNTPASTSTTSQFAALSAALHDNSIAAGVAKGLASGRQEPTDEDDDVPPPLPTSPPPTDEELEELERQIVQKAHIIDAEVSLTQHKPPTEAPGKAQRTPSGDNQDNSSVENSDHGIGRPTSSKVFEKAGTPASAAGFRGFTAINKIDETSSNAEQSPPKVLKPPPGFGGSDAAISSTDESEPEKSRFKLTKRFGKPKFVKIPKKLLPQMKRAGSMGKRSAPPAPQAKKRPVLEISAPILQQVSDPTRIAASQELRVSFQEPVAARKSPISKDSTEGSSKDSPATGSPGILKKKPAFIYRSPHGGSYEDMVDKRGSLPSGDNSLYDVPNPARPVSQVSSRPASQVSSRPGSQMGSRPVSQVSSSSAASSNHDGRPHHQPQSVQRQNSAQSVDRKPSQSRSASRQSSITKPTKTPPPRPSPIPGTPMSAPHLNQHASQRPPLRQSVSMTASPTVHHSSGAVYRQSSVGERSVISENHPEFTPGPQPQRGRRRSHRPSAPPPPRPKMPPPPRPPGPPPGRVGAHGDGVYLERQLSGSNGLVRHQHPQGNQNGSVRPQHPQGNQNGSVRPQHPQNYNGSVRPQHPQGNYNGSVRPQYPQGKRVSGYGDQQDSSSDRSIVSEQAQGSRNISYVDLQDSVESVPANRTFTVTSPNSVPHSNQDMDDNSSDSVQMVSSHLTESTDFDEVDFPGAKFEVIAMTDHSKKLHPGPRDSFRKYKKDKGSSVKRTSFTEDKSLSALNAKSSQQQNNASQSIVGRSKAKSQTLPNIPSPANSLRRGEDLLDYHVNHNKPRSLTLGRTEGTVIGSSLDSWGDPMESPTKRPPRPPPPMVSPTSPTKKFLPTGYNEDSGHMTRAEKPVKPPRKDKIRRSTETYLANEKGELSFEEDAVIRDIGEVSMVPDRPGWSVGMLDDGMIGVYPTSTAITVTSIHLNESD